jgi:hypothetical protein
MKLYYLLSHTTSFNIKYLRETASRIMLQVRLQRQLGVRGILALLSKEWPVINLG